MGEEQSSTIQLPSLESRDNIWREGKDLFFLILLLPSSLQKISTLSQDMKLIINNSDWVDLRVYHAGLQDCEKSQNGSHILPLSCNTYVKISKHSGYMNKMSIINLVLQMRNGDRGKKRMYLWETAARLEIS